MNELLVGLLSVGALVLLGLAIYNRIEERRFRKRLAQEFNDNRPDPFQPVADIPGADNGAITFAPNASHAFSGSPPSRPPSVATDEPSFDVGKSSLDDEPQFHIPDDSDDRSVPAAFAPVEPEPEAPAASVPPTPRASKPALEAPGDDLLDFCLRIDGDGVHGNVFSDVVTRCRGFHRPVRWWGLQVGAQSWQELQPWRDVRYEHLLVAVQLADRNGATTPDELTAVCALIEPLTRRNNLHLAHEDIALAAQRASALDALCLEVDLLIGLNIVTRNGAAFTLDPVLHIATAAGLSPKADGSYQLLDNRGEALYQLVNHDAEPFDKNATSTSVTLQFDVPRVPDGVQMFNSMVDLGVKIAEAVGGQLVDDNLRPLTESGVEKICAELARIHERMDARGIPVGSPRALRLFA